MLILSALVTGGRVGKMLIFADFLDILETKILRKEDVKYGTISRADCSGRSGGDPSIHSKRVTN